MIYIDLLGLLGTFLLAVEAIKTKNFVRLREKFFTPSRQILNPKIKFVDVIDEKVKKGKRKFFLIWLIIVISTGCLLLFVLNSEYEIISSTNFISQNIVLLAILCLFVIFLGGALVWTILIYSIQLLEVVLIAIERNTTSGVVGILGFVLILVSYLLKWFLAPQK